MKEETKDKVYNVIFWFSMGLILFWMVMKVLGIWESPVWQELVPYAGGIFTFGVFYQNIQDVKKQLKDVVKDVANIKINLAKVETKIEHMDRDIGLLRSDIEALRAQPL